MEGFSKIGLKGYRPEKAAQMAAYFSAKHNRSIDKLKLIKLIYLGERESIKKRRRPMIYDELYSLEHGPICSNALNGINGISDAGIWRRYVTLAQNKKTVRNKSKHNNYDQLSKSDIKVLDKVWADFGWMSTPQIRKWTHDNCDEYTPVESGRVPINYKDLFAAVGYSNAAELEDTIREYRLLEAALEFVDPPPKPKTVWK